MSEEPKQEIKRNDHGHWLPGQSGNPDNRWKQGQSGNPEGKWRNAGSYVKEWINQLVAKDLTEAELKAIQRDKSLPSSKRIAAERILRALESPDIADFEAVLDGQKSLAELRHDGVDTKAVKKVKTKRREIKNGDAEPIIEVERELEMHDRALEEVKMVIDYTDGKPQQGLTITHEVSMSEKLAILRQLVAQGGVKILPVDPKALPEGGQG